MDRPHVLVDGLVDSGTMKNLSRTAGYQTPDPCRHNRGNLFRWSLAILLMLVLHGFWWFWMSPPAGNRPPSVPRGPTLRVLIGASGQRIWTPTVLALPTDIGFSGTTLTNEFGVGPTIRMPRGPVRFLERAGYDAVSEAKSEVWTRPPLVVRSPPPPAPAVPPGSAIPRVHPGGVTLLAGGSLVPDPGLELDPRILDGLTPWTLSAWVDFDDQGQVDHVLIESSSNQRGVDPSILRALYRWRPDPASSLSTGSIEIRFVPSPDAAP